MGNTMSACWEQLKDNYSTMILCSDDVLQQTLLFVNITRLFFNM